MKRSDLHFPGIYKFTNKTNGMVYVGQAGDIYKRLCGHRRLRSTTRFGNALKKYGLDEFIFEVLEQVDDLTRLNEREQFWMDFYQCYDKSKGYNLTPTAGSQRGFKASKEQLEKMKIIGKQLFEGGFRPFANRLLSEEAIESIRQKNRLWKPSPEQYAKYLINNKPPTPEQQATGRKRAIEILQLKIQQINIETNEVVKVWDSINEIKVNSEFNHHGVAKACRGYYWSVEREKYIKVNSYKGFKWQYETEGKIIRPQKPKVILEPIGKFKKIAQIDLETGKVVKIWDTASHIESELGLKKESIQNVCRGKCYYNKKKMPKLSFAGFNWQYVE
ncbi:GIY-YIG nuclease family protein [Spirosoma agri]|uniref:GIY-YIG nuclease family protein n=1 Tax=Spirosoma agri TaxID=1987381 RepID=A0A6M0IIU5_9BACT|nr:GIY-YIG nuclease family protein [Spirosoma agri]NEU67777.1 GIY-YIG nuclease family protein [Spirosoma agri]